MLEFLVLTGTLRELAFEGNDKHLLEKIIAVKHRDSGEF